jgi:hypothetical protein
MDLESSIRMWKLIAMEAVVKSQHASEDVKNSTLMVRDCALTIAANMEYIMQITQCTCEKCCPVKH